MGLRSCANTCVSKRGWMTIRQLKNRKRIREQSDADYAAIRAGEELRAGLRVVSRQGPEQLEMRGPTRALSDPALEVDGCVKDTLFKD